jgi:Trm5-related predicted tRNA methylase
MSEIEIATIKRKIQAIEDVLNHRIDVKEAVEMGIPAPALNLDRNFRMYKEMSEEQLRREKEQLQREKEQLQEKENLLLRGISPLVLYCRN